MAIFYDFFLILHFDFWLKLDFWRCCGILVNKYSILTTVNIFSIHWALSVSDVICIFVCYRILFRKYSILWFLELFTLRLINFFNVITKTFHILQFGHKMLGEDHLTWISLNAEIQFWSYQRIITSFVGFVQIVV